MKPKSKSSRVLDRYGMIEALEQRIAPAAALTNLLPANPTFVTVTSGGNLLLKAGDVLTTGSGGGGIYLLYVEQGQVLVHTTDLNANNQVDFNEITGLSVGNGARIISFVDIHGDVVTDLNPDGTLSDHGKGDILLDNNIAEIDLRSLTNADFAGTALQAPAQLVAARLAMSSYSIYGNIYAGGGLGLATDPTSGLHIIPNGGGLQAAKYGGGTGTDQYVATEPVIGSIYVGSSASDQAFTFGSSGSVSDIHGNLLAFTPAPGEAGASIYNVQSDIAATNFSIGTIHAGNGGFNAPGGNIVNATLSGDNSGVYQVIAGNAGNGTTGQAGGSIINFSETGTTISEVVLQSGNGGTGLTGAGGNAGSITFKTGAVIGINAHFLLNYGNGGDGYTAGGNGGGTPSGVFVTPEGQATQAHNLVTTMHTIGAIGSTTPFDFNNDGFSDAVYATTTPNQVVVAFGGFSATTGLFGLDDTKYLYLNAPAAVDSIVVGDFTGALNPVVTNPLTGQHVPELDIAVASSGPNYSGVEVFVSKYNPVTGAFEGFSDPLFTPLPALTTFGYYNTSVPITKLVAGDFTGNGVLDLAVLAQERVIGGPIDNVLIFLSGETDAIHPAGTGYFYANFANGYEPFIDFGNNFSATKSIFEVTALQQYTPTVPTPPGATPNLSNGHDVIIEADLGAKAFNVIDDSGFETINLGLGIVEQIPVLTPFFSGGAGFGQVDTDRALGAKHIADVDFQVQGIAVTEGPNLSLTNPNPAPIANIVALSQNPAHFLATFSGDGLGNFLPASQDGGDNAGIDFGGNTTAPVAIVAVPNSTPALAAGIGVSNPTLLNISGYLAAPTTAPYFSYYSDVAVLDYNTTGADLIYVLKPDIALTSAIGTAEFVTIAPAGRDGANVAWDAYYPHPAGTPLLPGSGLGSIGFITGNPLNGGGNAQDLAISQPLYPEVVTFGGGIGGGIVELFGGAGYSIAPFKDAGYFVTAGHGGNSESGPGGAGGSLGQTLTVNNQGGVLVGTGSLSFVLPADETYQGIVRLIGGPGGNGFTAGGAGGTLEGISVTYNNAGALTGTALFLAGNGGQSLTATGGSGGSISQLYVITGELFVAGNGGIGVVGGAGGNLLGNTQTGLVTTEANDYEDVLVLKAGDGANGINGGGNGGGINSFVDHFPPLLGGVGGLLNYYGGNGGDAVAGRGGTGGAVINSSPYLLDNNLVGDIYLQGGAGGNGLYGGAGGAVTTFSQISTIKDIPTSSTIIGGNGGTSTLGTGGAGGGISGINVAAAGVGDLYTFSFLTPASLESVADALTAITPVTYNRMVAGVGGDSSGGAGGAGGSISTIQAASVNSAAQAVLAAGAGGTGLTAGGAGGSVISTNVNAGSTTGKVVIIAGAGGAATGARPADPKNPIDVALALGGVDGPGGTGGSITGFTQPVSTNTHVDLIAGNGGDTPNHSVAAGNATTDNSGRGGSISGISVAGSIGNPASDVAILSYNNIFTGITSNGVVTGTSMQDFVTNYILGDASAPIDDTIGNVGLVAGAAGLVEGTQPGPVPGSIVPAPGTLAPSSAGVNGSVNNVHAENITSMVAGNVELVSLIQDLTNYGVTISGGILGASKTVWYNPVAGVDETSVGGNISLTPLPGAPPQLNYIGPDGAYSNTPLPGGGELIDGAFIAFNVRVIESNRDFIGTQTA